MEADFCVNIATNVDVAGNRAEHAKLSRGIIGENRAALLSELSAHPCYIVGVAVRDGVFGKRCEITRCYRLGIESVGSLGVFAYFVGGKRCETEFGILVAALEHLNAHGVG